MPLTVTGVTEIYKQGTGLEVAGSLAGGATAETGLFYAGTGCYGNSFASGVNEMSATVTSPIDLTGKLVVFRFGHTTGLEALETIANGGCVVRIGSSSANYKEFTVGGQGARNAGGCWITIVIDPSVTSTATVGTPNMASATFFAIETSLAGEAGGDTDNQFLDMITVVGKLTVTGTSTNFWNDLAAWSDTNKYDIVRNIGGVIFARCKVEVDSGVGNTVISDTGRTVAFANDEFYNGTIWTDSIDGANMGFSVAKNGAGSVDVTFGELSGTDGGTNGIQFIGESGIEFDISAAGVASCHLYGCTIKGATITNLHGGSNCYGTTFDGCSMVSPSTMSLRNCTIKNFSGAATDAAVLWDVDNTDIDTTSFISSGTGYAVKITALGAGNFPWGGNSASGYAVVNGSTGDEVMYVTPATGTLNGTKDAGNPAPTYHTLGATVNFPAGTPVTTLITCKEFGTNALIQGVRVLLKAASGGALPVGTEIIRGLTDVNGEISDTRTYSSDQPFTGWCRKMTGPGTLYKEFPLAGVINSASGISTVALMSVD